MTTISFIIDLLGAYWYVVLPEVLFLGFLGFRFIGPWTAVLIAAYFVGLLVAPAETMAFVAAMIIVGAVILMVRNIAGDIVSKKKEAEEYNASNGVPKLSGQNKDVQDALDEMKRKNEE